MLLPAVRQGGADGAEAQTLRAVFDELQLVRVDVAGQDVAAVGHVHGQGEGLATGGGADVQHPGVLVRGGGQGHQPRRRVLHGAATLREGGQGVQGELAEALFCAGDGEASLQPRVGRDLRARRLQLLPQCGGGGFQGVGLYGGGHGLVVQRQKLLRFLPAQQLYEPLHQPAGVAVLQGQPIRVILAPQGR